MVHILIKEGLFSQNGNLDGLFLNGPNREENTNKIFWNKISTFYFKIIDHIEEFKKENPDKVNDITEKFEKDIADRVVVASIKNEKDIVLIKD